MELVEVAQIGRELQSLIEKLDDMDIKDLVDAGISSCHLEDMGEILLDLSKSINYYRDRPFYKGRKLRRVK